MIKVSVISGGRADWGLLSPVCKALQEDDAFDMRIIVTGQHLMSEASSIKAIEHEGFSVHARVDMRLSNDDSPRAIIKALGQGISGLADEFESNRPDVILVLGDRYEILGAVQAATLFKIPVAHLFGGDVTEGAIDDAMRHAITKLSHIHFVTNEDAKHRVLQMGEKPENVHWVGSTGLDHIHTMEKMNRDDFFNAIDFNPLQKNILITFHPVTLEENSIDQCSNMLQALSRLEDVGMIFTGSNADPEGQEITELIRNYAEGNKNSCFHESLGTLRYLNALTHVDAMVGNSSSGLYEAPSFGIPTINIGNRQNGRLKAPSVIDCTPETGAIFDAVNVALTKPRTEGENPYGDGHSAKRIVEILKKIQYTPDLCRKTFKNLEKAIL